MDTLFVDLFRHGEPALKGVYLGRTDSPLSVKGQSTCEAVLANGEWDLVVSSPLKRALESARWLANTRQIELQVWDELQELDFGDWDGVSFEQVYSENPVAADKFWQAPQDYPAPNGETIQQFKQRIAMVKERLLKLPEKKVLVVTHGGVIRCLIGDILGIEADHWRRIAIDYAHFTKLRFDYDSKQCWPQLLSSNIQHLPDSVV
ncbi:histidine phosphatase family protein [Neptuniibacter sp. QD72_48]|uniref:histidine phosphatase family protein n=1 Tax=unclassified Neptuniibacter TaxID=2630693 RepID=UPI0039F45B73